MVIFVEANLDWKMERHWDEQKDRSWASNWAEH
jgi:hypothetical protein